MSDAVWIIPDVVIVAYIFVFVLRMPPKAKAYDKELKREARETKKPPH